MPFWLAALFGFLIVARVTRFLNSDYLFTPVRDRVEGWTNRGKLYYLLTCPWCASIWIAAPVATYVVGALSNLTGWAAVYATVGLWLGYSYLYGLCAEWLDGDE